jgi:hypothetical protein
VADFLEREGLLVRDDDNDYLVLDGLEDAPMLQIYGYSIGHLIATGKQQGRKVFTLQTIAPMVKQGSAPGFAVIQKTLSHLNSKMSKSSSLFLERRRPQKVEYRLR